MELENLAVTIRELSSEFLSSGDDDHHRSEDPHRHLIMMDSSSATHTNPSSMKESSRNSSMKPSVDCIFVDHEQYYDGERPVMKSETPHWKLVFKTMKAISQKGEQFLIALADPSTVDAGETLPIFAVCDISFWALRDFGTNLMKRCRQEKTTIGACRQTTEDYPKFKRILKTLGAAIESHMKRNGYWSSLSSYTTTSSSSSSNHNNINSGQRGGGSVSHGERRHLLMVSMLLYSREDDRFDMISLESEAKPDSSNETGRGSSRRK